MTPSPDDRVERFDQSSRPLPPVAGGHVPDLPVMPGHRHPARFDDGLVATPCAARVLAHVEPEDVEPGSAFDHFQPMPTPGLARFPLQTPRTQPGCHQGLTWLDDFPVGMEPDQIIGLADHRRGPPTAGNGVPAHLFQAVQRRVGE